MRAQQRATISWLFVAAAAAAGLLAACGGSSSPAPPPGPCDPGGVVSLVYPAPNATAIPDNFAGVVFGTLGPLASTSQALVLPAGAAFSRALQPIVAPAPTPLPSPYATPTGYANPIFSESASGGYILPAATSIGVYYNNFASNCTPTLEGSFTSQ